VPVARLWSYGSRSEPATVKSEGLAGICDAADPNGCEWLLAVAVDETAAVVYWDHHQNNQRTVRMVRCCGLGVQTGVDGSYEFRWLCPHGA
jgi:hypothetical protein